jgi:L-ribulose-5-phosphate 4-epimerase
MADELREIVCRANCELQRSGLVVSTFGNVSGIDRRRGCIAIKPSGVPYAELRPENIPLIDLDGNIVEGQLRPSSDTPTHLELYRAFENIGGVAHTHSTLATAFAQARRPIPCLGTTHADYFRGDVPVTRPPERSEVESDYEKNIGKIIVELFDAMDPAEMPAVLVAAHGPFTWGADALEAAHTSVLLEEIAGSSMAALQLADPAPPLPKYLLDKHFLRKHGADAYYGQK